MKPKENKNKNKNKNKHEQRINDKKNEQNKQE